MSATGRRVACPVDSATLFIRSVMMFLQNKETTTNGRFLINSNHLEEKLSGGNGMTYPIPLDWLIYGVPILNQNPSFAVHRKRYYDEKDERLSSYIRRGDINEVRHYEAKVGAGIRRVHGLNSTLMAIC